MAVKVCNICHPRSGRVLLAIPGDLPVYKNMAVKVCNVHHPRSGRMLLSVPRQPART